ncbi:hypothetical protein ACJJIW_18715 [Microbulbifer sp. JMSA004]|uniref:hypothetical protein n=1 Tax=Microbulbifer sp. JMSA004 TaxID=3243370 RepID=UPI00403A2037
MAEEVVGQNFINMEVKIEALIELPISDQAYDLRKECSSTARDELLTVSGYRDLVGYSADHQFHSLSKLNDNNLARAIELHISDFEVKDCCAFFGGFALVINGVNKLFPQCCGTMADLESWMRLKSESDLYIAIEGHPSPRAFRKGDKVIIECIDDEPFIPATDRKIEVDYPALCEAIGVAESEIIMVANRIDGLASSMGLPKNTSIHLLREMA